MTSPESPRNHPSRAADWLADTLGYRFADPELLLQALTHRSARGSNNERLEFLGDSVLGVVVSGLIFSSHSDASEGDLSRLRASLVKDDSLAQVAESIALGPHLVLGPGERKSGGQRRTSILADALEAIFAAVYLDGGLDAAQRVIRQAFGERLENLPDVADLRDPKTKLQEWLQARAHAVPEYDLLDVAGAEHRRQFTVSCRVEPAPGHTEGVGSTRRKAEQQAARRMLRLLKGEAPA